MVIELSEKRLLYGEKKPYLEDTISFSDIKEWAGYKNCQRNRRDGAKICENCPLGRIVEWFENPPLLKRWNGWGD